MDQLIDFVARRAGLTPAQARVAVRAMLDFLTASLPSPVVGRIHELLHDTRMATTEQNQGQKTTLP